MDAQRDDATLNHRVWASTVRGDLSQATCCPFITDVGSGCISPDSVFQRECRTCPVCACLLMSGASPCPRTPVHGRTLLEPRPSMAGPLVPVRQDQAHPTSTNKSPWAESTAAGPSRAPSVTKSRPHFHPPLDAQAMTLKNSTPASPHLVAPALRLTPLKFMLHHTARQGIVVHPACPRPVPSMAGGRRHWEAGLAPAPPRLVRLASSELHFAAANGRVSEVERLVVSEGFDVNSVDRQGEAAQRVKPVLRHGHAVSPPTQAGPS